MDKLSKLLSAAAITMISHQAMAIPFEPTFSDYSFTGSQSTVDATANAFFSTNYGITIDNAYLYRDSRDTFDGIGISVGVAPNTSVPELSTLTFLDTTDFVSVDYWGIRTTTYTAYDAANAVLDSFTIGANTLGTYLFNTGGNIISHLTWESDGGFGQISGLRYDYDGTTDGSNDDIGNVPEPATMALFGLGLLGIGYTRRKSV